MKFYLISDNIDTRAGLRLAGIEGVVVHTKQEVEDALDDAARQQNAGVILITENLARLAPDRVSSLKLTRELPLIIEIPDRHGTRRAKDSITRYVNDSLGIKLDK